MLRIATPHTNAANARDYFTQHLAQGDYYAKEPGRDIVGNWHGQGASLLGIEGQQVTPEMFDALANGRHPQTGEKLTQRIKSNRRVGTDISFHAPKSVSVVYEMTGDERILDTFRQSVHDTMADIEADVQVRVRKGGRNENRTSGNIIYGEFVHFETRPLEDGRPDMHLHSHCYFMNLSHDPVEKCWKAAEWGNVKQEASYYEAAFHARFARRLQDQGYAVQRTEKGWELAGVPESVMQKFSRRTSEIEAEAVKRGVTDAKEKDALGARTRRSKKDDLSREDLRKHWAGRMTKEERQAIVQAALGDQWESSPAVTARQAMDHALLHSFERQSVVSEKRLMATALRYGVGSVKVDGVKREVDREEVITREVGGRRLSTTEQVLAEEKRMIAFARDGRGLYRRFAADQTITRDWLSEEQAAAVRHVWESRDRVMAIRGGAGTGKTALMKEAVEGLEAHGAAVVTLAPSAEASRGVLRDEGFTGAETVARFLQDEKLQAQVSGGVIWVDEAGLVGTRTLGQVFEVAGRRNARVVLSGDVRQHGSVERGDALRVLEQQAGIQPAEIKEIRRQRGAYKEAIREISKGSDSGMRRGFALLEDMGAVEEIASVDERNQRIAEEYVAGERAGKRMLVVSPTHAEGRRLTGVIREHLKTEGNVDTDNERRIQQLRSLSWTQAERRDAARYREGMVIQFMQNTKGGFTRGDRVRVVEATDGGGVIVQRESQPPAGHPRVPGVPGRTLLPLEHAAKFQVYDTAVLDLATGDKIRITQNGFTKDKKHRLNNGQVYSVAKFTAGGTPGRPFSHGDIVLENGWIIPKDYGHLSHGYVQTSHSSQGKTVDRVLISQSAMSFAASSREQFYVSASRGREQLKVFTDDSEGLKDMIQSSGERKSASEMVGEAEQQLAEKQARKRREEKGRDFAAKYATVPADQTRQQNGRGHGR